MPINADWHHKHPMPGNPSTSQRLAWHRQHAKHCGCRPIPDKLRALIENAGPVSMLCTYLPKAGKERALLSVLKTHGATLDRAGLVSKERARLWKARDKRTGRVSYVETFQWKGGEASDIAHRTPAVRKLWNAMEEIMDDMRLMVLEEVPLHPSR